MLRLILWATVLCCLSHVDADTIIIEEITCIQAATGISTEATAAVAALSSLAAVLGTAIAGGAVVVGTGGAAIGTVPLTLTAVAKAAAGGLSAGITAMHALDKLTSGEDDLIVTINGVKVWPTGGLVHGRIEAGQTIRPNIHFDVDGDLHVTNVIRFLEHDSDGSGHDDLGQIPIFHNEKKGKNYDRTLMTYSKKEGDLYQVKYSVKRNNKGKKPRWLQCGVSVCIECFNDPCCKKTSRVGLDKDKDKEDVRKCPPKWKNRGWKTFNLLFPAADVYLRICANSQAWKMDCSQHIDVEGYERRMISERTQE